MKGDFWHKNGQMTVTVYLCQNQVAYQKSASTLA